MSSDAQQLQAAESLPENLTLMKLENEQIFALARTAPRNPAAIVKQLADLIEAYPAAADEAIYSKPVGSVCEVACPNPKCAITFELQKVDRDSRCPACDADASQAGWRKVKKFAEGLSIRAAESIRSVFGYTRLATTTETLADDRVRITGTLVDYAAGNLTSDERIVSPWYKSRGGAMAKTPEDRFLNVVVKAEKAKLRRDVILDNTPAIVKARFRDLCEEKMKALVAPEVIEQKIVPLFATYGITAEQLDAIVGKPRALGWSEEDRLGLRKLANALKHGETTPREVLAGLKQQADPRTAADPSSGSIDVAGEIAKKRAAAEAEPEPTPPAMTAAETQATRAAILDILGEAAPTAVSFDEVASAIAAPEAWVFDAARGLVEDGLVADVNGGLSLVAAEPPKPAASPAPAPAPAPRAPEKGEPKKAAEKAPGKPVHGPEPPATNHTPEPPASHGATPTAAPAASPATSAPGSPADQLVWGIKACEDPAAIGEIVAEAAGNADLSEADFSRINDAANERRAALGGEPDAGL